MRDPMANGNTPDMYVDSFISSLMCPQCGKTHSREECNEKLCIVPRRIRAQYCVGCVGPGRGSSAASV